MSLRALFAVECRKLADECEAGTAPPMIAYALERRGQRCALGWALHRLNLGTPEEARGEIIKEFPARDEWCAWAWRAVAEANNDAKRDARALAVVPHLRALAAALDAAVVSGEAPAAPKGNSP